MRKSFFVLLVNETVYPDGKRYTAEVLSGTNAEKILLHCPDQLNM